MAATLVGKSSGCFSSSQLQFFVELTVAQGCGLSSPQHSIAGTSPRQHAISQLATHCDPANAMGIQPKQATTITNPVINRLAFWKCREFMRSQLVSGMAQTTGESDTNSEREVPAIAVPLTQLFDAVRETNLHGNFEIPDLTHCQSIYNAGILPKQRDQFIELLLAFGAVSVLHCLSHAGLQMIL